MKMCNFITETYKKNFLKNEGYAEIILNPWVSAP